jgi:crotonobetainyl-CoA:carnitine CoA-transferase CaiB-like acyl-CoA transferase
VSALYLCANRNVRSLAIDLKHPSAKEVVFRLIERSHVVAENFRPTTLDRLGFGYDAVKARKPDVIYASASGFGASGPYAARPGQDLLVQAMSGLATLTRRNGMPIPVGSSVVDQHGAVLFAMAIAAAYAGWLKTGEGTRVESTLLGAAIDLQTESIVTHRASGLGQAGFVRRDELATWFHAAPYGLYKAKDCFVALSLNEIASLAAALDSADIERFVDRDAFAERDELAEVVAGEIAKRTFDELSGKFDVHGVWYGRVEDYDDLMENPQARHNGSFCDVSVNNELATLVSHPVQYNGAVPKVRHVALAAGADTRDILAQAGFSTQEIGELVRDQVVFAGEG